MVQYCLFCVVWWLLGNTTTSQHNMDNSSFVSCHEIKMLLCFYKVLLMRRCYKLFIFSPFVGGC